MQVALRPALPQDFEYCRRLYFAEMKWIIEELHLDQAAQEAGFQQEWDPSQVRIIARDGADIGWLQTITQAHELFIAQIFVDHAFQRKGIGTEVVKHVISEARQFSHAVRLNVVKINPAKRLYERLGFEVTNEDDRKFYMSLTPSATEPRSG
jgi:GNAT superfamily N-acetyltransferase